MIILFSFAYNDAVFVFFIWKRWKLTDESIRKNQNSMLKCRELRLVRFLHHIAWLSVIRILKTAFPILMHGLPKPASNTQIIAHNMIQKCQLLKQSLKISLFLITRKPGKQNEQIRRERDLGLDKKKKNQELVMMNASLLLVGDS